MTDEKRVRGFGVCRGVGVARFSSGNFDAMRQRHGKHRISQAGGFGRPCAAREQRLRKNERRAQTATSARDQLHNDLRAPPSARKTLVVSCRYRRAAHGRPKPTA